MNEEQIELLVDRLIERMYEANTYFLKSVGSSIKKIRELTPTKAHQLVQILKYGGTYDDIIRQISKYTDLNIKEVDTIFAEYAKRDQQFYKKFYQYRNIPFKEYAENESLKRQTKALSNMVKREMYNMTRENVLGYTINGKFYGMRDTYNNLLDTALLNVGQGKETFDSAMSHILKEIGGSGIRTIDYESGRHIRLDSAVRMHLKDGLRQLHNENQQLFGQEFDADGVEITVHSNPAEDHCEVQGRQFTNEEYQKLQLEGMAKDYKGKVIDITRISKSGNVSFRPISTMNCYHEIRPVVLGINKPEYSDKQLREINEENEKGFELYDQRTDDYKHYTLYEGTQMQRELERRIREQKDIQILARESGNTELVGQIQQKITQLTNRYKELTQESGLPTRLDRAKVSGYRRVKV